jgi:hypothetical protein
MDSAGERLWLRFFWQNAKVVDVESWTASGIRHQASEFRASLSLSRDDDAAASRIGDQGCG